MKKNGSNENANKSLEVVNKNKKRKIVFIFSVIFLVAALVFIIYKATVPEEYLIFTKERINSLEQAYNMDLSNAEPKKYWIPSMAQDTYDCFSFRVDDYNDFMENCYFGETLSFYESEDKSYAEYKCKPYYNDADKNESDFTFLIEFSINGEIYDAYLISYYE